LYNKVFVNSSSKIENQSNDERQKLNKFHAFSIILKVMKRRKM